MIMPNHIHEIIILNDSGRGEVTSPLRGSALGEVVAYFKHQSTKAINAINGTPGYRIWQRNYLPCEVGIKGFCKSWNIIPHRVNEHIIRDDKDLNNTRDYIENNVLKWSDDKEYSYVGI
jgi:putative transposase